MAGALLSVGLAAEVWTGLHRVRSVRKSATALGGERPTVEEHCRSLIVESRPSVPERLLIVDDIVTKGRTLLAAATVLRSSFPEAEIRAFALARTLGRRPTLEHLVLPCEGAIEWLRGDACRRP